MRVRKDVSGRAAQPGPREVVAAALRRERTRAALSLSELAARAGIAKSTLSQLESGGGNPSIETLWALCVALDIPFSRLLDPPRPSVHVIRAGEGQVVSAAVSHYQVALLAAGLPSSRRDIFRVTAEPGQPHRSQPHMAGVVEHVMLAEGRAMAGLAAEPVELRPGDYVQYPGDLPHVFEALAPGTWAILVNEYT
ncbi:helix-turn-helix domain-containing protein [Nocardia panacis]|uniref:helix-turn-helix domain-containing protein n=1 Tax=Nocardia panacis TaxID=2340916 RepID=UPI00267DB4CD